MASRTRNRKNGRRAIVRNQGSCLQRHARPHNNFRLLEPEEIEVNFDDIFGHEELRKSLGNLIGYLEHPEIYGKHRPHLKYIFVGAAGIGKETLACAVAKKVGLPILVTEPSFFYNTGKLLEELDDVFEKVYSQERNCILLIKNVEYLFSLEDKIRQPFIELLINYFREIPELAVFTTAAGSCEFPDQFVEEPAFTKVVALEVPELKVREEILKHFLEGMKVDETLDLHQLALDATDMPIGGIKHFIRDAFLIQIQNKEEKLSYKHFWEAMAQNGFGFANTSLDKFEKLATARHEAGHVIAGYFANPEEYKLSKVDITPRSRYCGITMETIDENKKSFFRKDYENQIISFLGGMAAEVHYYGSPSSGVQADLEQALVIAFNMVQAFGMSDKLGPICMISDQEITLPTLDKCADMEISKIIKKCYKRSQKIIAENLAALEELTSALMEKEVLYGEEVMAILKKHKNIKPRIT